MINVLYFRRVHYQEDRKLKHVLCVLFLQSLLVSISMADTHHYSAGKANQSHSPSSHVAKRVKHVLRHKKEPANSFASSKRSGECKRCPKWNNKKHGKSSPERYVNAKGVRRVTVSYYKSGRITANGELFNRYAMTVAHKTLPFNSKFEFINRKNGKRVVLRVNDRGPYIPGREFDLTLGAAQKLGLVEDGVADVYVRKL